MPLTRVTAEVNGENATFEGVALVDFCNKTGAMWDTQTIKVISTDGQSAALNIFQAWNSTAYPYYKESNRIVLAFVKNGEWMTQETGGPVKLITPSFGSEYQIDNVAEVNVESWTVSISGAVAKPLTISSKKLDQLPARNRSCSICTRRWRKNFKLDRHIYVGRPGRRKHVL